MSAADKTFGGKAMVLGGDFRQILPVIPKGTRQDIVEATVNSPYLRDSCKVLGLTKNLRLQNMDSITEKNDLHVFANWIASIGGRTIGRDNDGKSEIDVPTGILLQLGDDPIVTIVDNIFRTFRSGVADYSVLHGRAILAPTLNVFDRINNYLSDMNHAEGKTYLSSDSVCKTEGECDMLSELHTPEFLNNLKCSEVSNHCLVLKVGTPITLLRNIDNSMGLCNVTRLVITRLADRVLEAKIIDGKHIGAKVLIPRMSLTPLDPQSYHLNSDEDSFQ